MTVSGNLLYIAALDSFLIVDIDNPNQPRLLSRTIVSNYLNSIDVAGQYAYITAQQYGLLIFDVSNPSSPRQIGSPFIEPDYAFNRVRARDGYAFICCGPWVSVEGPHLSFIVVDVNNPNAPHKVASLDDSVIFPGGADLTLFGRYALMSSLANSTLNIIDINNPLHPVLRSSTWAYPHTVFQFELKNNYIYGAGVRFGFNIFRF
jgi:hypothetical protein